MRRIVMLLTVAAMMAVMMVVSAAPAFALPPNPIRGFHGQQVSAVAKFYPVDPIAPISHGKAVSSVARGLAQCGQFVDNCPPAP